jgi:carboxymethylenebutenolidase
MVKEQTVDKQANLQATPNLTPAQEALQAVWEEHIGYEFGTHSLSTGQKIAKGCQERVS